MDNKTAMNKSISKQIHDIAPWDTYIGQENLDDFKRNQRNSRNIISAGVQRSASISHISHNLRVNQKNSVNRLSQHKKSRINSQANLFQKFKQQHSGNASQVNKKLDKSKHDYQTLNNLLDTLKSRGQFIFNKKRMQTKKIKVSKKQCKYDNPEQFTSKKSSRNFESLLKQANQLTLIRKHSKKLVKLPQKSNHIPKPISSTLNNDYIKLSELKKIQYVKKRPNPYFMNKQIYKIINR